MKDNKKARLLVGFILLLLASFGGIFYSTSLHMLLTKKSNRFDFYPLNFCISSILENKQQQLIFLAFVCVCVCVYIALFVNNFGNFRAELYEVAPNIKIPKPCGQGQHGTSWWMDDSIFHRKYGRNTVNAEVNSIVSKGYDDLPPELQKHGQNFDTYLNTIVQEKKLMFGQQKKRKEKKVFKDGGLVVGMSNKAINNYLSFVKEDTHSLIVGATRCGKTRCLVLPTIVNLGLSGESMIISDPKGELYEYTYPFLKRIGYNIIVLNYKDMKYSSSYNLLQPIIDSFKNGNTNKALQQAKDMAHILVGERGSNTEPLWTNGEIAVIAAIIVAVVYDNQNHPENQNLSYIYEFLIRMCESKSEREGGMPLKRYLRDVGEDHPANSLLSQSSIAPEKTRSSFYTSAASTLSIWTDRELFHISNKSDFCFTDIVKQKTAFFIILPDDKKTFYKVASLIVSQLYEQLVYHADITLGTGRLDRRVNFVLDEFGNFAEIESFDTKLSVAGGRGIRFDIFVQDLKQLNEKYGDNVAETIKANCETWVYLKANDKDTKEEIKHKLGTYTTSSYSLTASKHSNGSESMSLISRDLLTADEIGRFERPYQLVLGNGGQKVCYSPDLSQVKWLNAILGLGDKKHNELVRKARGENQAVKNDVSLPINFTSPIWRNYIN